MQIITTQTTVFSFEELSEKSQAKAIDKECQILGENWTAEHVIESCSEWLSMLGFSNTKIYYSGFWSQGDGACFIGDYAFKKDTVEKIATEFPKFTELQDIAKRLYNLQAKMNYSISASISHYGRYYHENSMEVAIDVEDFNCELEEDFILICELEEDFILICKDIAQMIYKYLFECYESETSEDHAKEVILDNDFQFLECGKLYSY